MNAFQAGAAATQIFRVRSVTSGRHTGVRAGELERISPVGLAGLRSATAHAAEELVDLVA